MTKAEILKLVKDLQLTDAKELADLLDDIARMYRYIGADWDIDLGEVLHWPSKAAKGIHAIELVEAK